MMGGSAAPKKLHERRGIVKGGISRVSLAKYVPPLYALTVPEIAADSTVIGPAAVDTEATVEAPSSVPSGPAVVSLKIRQLLPPFHSRARPAVVVNSYRFRTDPLLLSQFTPRCHSILPPK